MKTRPGGRTARTRAAVSAAVDSLLSERDPATLGMADVAARAGIAPSSLYRRWGDIRTLLSDMAMQRLIRESPLPDTGSLTGDLQAWARAMAASFTDPQSSVFFRIALSAAPRSPAEAASRLAIVQPRQEQISLMLERASARGEQVPTIAQLTDYLIAPIYLRTLSGEKIDASAADALVDMLLRIADMTSRSPL